MVEQVDVVVIGMGPGGEEVAGRLAETGLPVVGVEKRLLGGECPYWGCVPSKMMVRAANLVAEARRIPDMAGEVTVRPDWTPVAARIRAEATDNWDDKVAVDRFVGKGGRFVRGHGRVSAPGEVTVGELVFRARRGIVLATGSQPVTPPVTGLAGTPYWTNREAIEADRVPGSLAVLGGGSVGVELAQVFGRFGAEVSVLEGSDRLLSTEEPEASELVTAALAADGITVRTDAQVEEVRYSDGRFAMLTAGEPVEAERLLVATGRRVDLRSLGVGVLGLDEGARYVAVDEHLRAAPGVWAVGDITGKGAFTHVAMYQAAIAARDILGEPGPGANYRALPRVTFTDPEVGTVGLTEAQARDAGIPVRTGSAQVPSSARGWIHKAGNAGFIKLVEDTDRAVLVGATSAGPVGGEVLSALAVAVHAEVPTAQLRQMIYAYPTFHGGISDALSDLAA
jgi:pyruvate/2-oxoglutarate dehydrogenase complex dihydrolipoamide dehydrogenase (E3) component